MSMKASDLRRLARSMQDEMEVYNRFSLWSRFQTEIEARIFAFMKRNVAASANKAGVFVKKKH